MGIKQLYNDNLRKLPNEYGDVFVMIYVQNVFLPNTFQTNGYISRKYCIDISITEEWYGIASGLISFRNNGVQKQQSYEQS